EVNWRLGSIPSRTSNDAAIGADGCARAPAPAVTLTASAKPVSGRALRSKSSAAQETGGVISAVMVNCRARKSVSRREAGCRGGGIIVPSKHFFGGGRARNAQWKNALI